MLKYKKGFFNLLLTEKPKWNNCKIQIKKYKSFIIVFRKGLLSGQLFTLLKILGGFF